jgi:3-deoxy-D-manno-octulosonate 8-phosphate phosphatase (KDO 8-P phosphatase)
MKPKTNYQKAFKEVQAVIMDIDGVLTDGFLHIMPNGREVRSIHIHDSYALEQAAKYLKLGIITGEKPRGMIRKLKNLGIKNIKANRDDKGKAFRELIKELKLDVRTTVYIGDDVLDIPPLTMCGFPSCPADAYSGVKAVSKYISPHNGGKGCVRDIIEQILKQQGKWKG